MAESGVDVTFTNWRGAHGAAGPDGRSASALAEIWCGIWRQARAGTSCLAETVGTVQFSPNPSSPHSSPINPGSSTQHSIRPASTEHYRSFVSPPRRSPARFAVPFFSANSALKEFIMLVTLGFLMVAVFMFLILTKRATPGGGTDSGSGGLRTTCRGRPRNRRHDHRRHQVARTHCGAVVLRDHLLRNHDRRRTSSIRWSSSSCGWCVTIRCGLVVGTAVLAMVVSLDGDGSTTFIIVTSALLPLYLKLGVSPVVLTVIAGLSNATMNIIPWGGPTVRAAKRAGTLALRRVRADGAVVDRRPDHGARIRDSPRDHGAPQDRDFGPDF